MRIPAIYIITYSLLTLLAIGLISHGAYTAFDNRPGTHHIIDGSPPNTTDPLLRRNHEMLAGIDEKLRKSNLKEGIWELTAGIPFLGWAGKMMITYILFNRRTPPNPPDTDT